MTATLTLSDGDVSRDLMSYVDTLADFTMPAPQRDLTFAESDDAEGRRRVRTRPLNGEGQIPLKITATSTESVWGVADDIQELVESAHREKGTLVYRPSTAASSVTYNLEAITVAEITDQTMLAAKGWCRMLLSFECQPYGQLASSTVALTT